MKTWGAVLRYSLLGLVALVLGTAAFSSGSEVGVVPEVAVAAEGVSAGEAATSRFVFPEEMPAEEKERWARVLEMRNGGSLMDPWWDDEIPHGCPGPSVEFWGLNHEIRIDGHDGFFECWVPEHNSAQGDSISYSSLIHPSNWHFNLQWGYFRGDTLLDYCNWNTYYCGMQTEYVSNAYYTCEESLLVVLWDERPPGSGPLLFGYEIFDGIPWEEYYPCP